VLVLGTLLLVPVTASAHPLWEWDEGRWRQLLAHGDELYEQALHEDDDAQYRELIRECLQDKQSALQMLRFALAFDEIHNLDRVFDLAKRDLYNLHENIIVLFLELDQCDAAEVQLRQASMEPSLLPDDGVQQLETLAPEIQYCRNAVDPPPFEEERFVEYVKAADDWHQRADTEDSPAGKEPMLVEASQIYGQAIELLRIALLDGRLDDPTGERESQLYRLYNDNLDVLFEANLCSLADRRLRQAVADTLQLPDGDPDVFRDRHDEVTACELRRLAASEGPLHPRCTHNSDCSSPQLCVERECRDPEEIVLRPPGNTRVAAYALWGVAGASAISSVVIWVADSDTRRRFDDMDARCTSGGPSCDLSELYELSNTVNNHRTAAAVLAGGAVVSAVVGTILYLTARDSSGSVDVDPEASSRFPTFSLYGTGGSVQVRF